MAHIFNRFTNFFSYKDIVFCHKIKIPFFPNYIIFNALYNHIQSRITTS